MSRTSSLIMLVLTALLASLQGYAKGGGKNPFDKKAVVRSADVIRETYENTPTVYLYQGNGRFGSSFGRLGLHLRPSEKDARYGKTHYLHLEHMRRARFAADYLIPVLEVYWQDDFRQVEDYRQQQSYLDATITTSFVADGRPLTVTTWFDPVEKNLHYITIDAKQAGAKVLVAPCEKLTLHYGQQLSQQVKLREQADGWEVMLDCLGRESRFYLRTNAQVVQEGNTLSLILKQGENRIALSYDAPTKTTARQSLKQTKAWWHDRWQTSGCILVPDDNAQNTWVRSMAMFLSSYDDTQKGLAPPMGYSGNMWPFYYPQDVSYVHPVLLATGHLDIARSWIEYWSQRVDGLRRYTKRLYGVEGILAPWVFPYGDFEGYHDPTPPNRFYYEIHNSGYLARMACETALFVDDEAWTRRYALPLLSGAAEFYANICTKGADGLWHLFVTPSMGQDERGGENQRDYLCALYSALYCFQQAVAFGVDAEGRYAAILKDGLAFEILKSPQGFYYSCAGRGESDFGSQKHPVQLNELAFLPVGTKPSESAAVVYKLRYDITRDAKRPHFYGWTLGEFLLAGSRMGDAEGWQADWANMTKSEYVDPEWIQIYETSRNLSTPFYNITNGLVAQSLYNNLVTDWYGVLEIAKCNPWQGRVAVRDIHSKLGIIVSGEINGKNYDVVLTAWKDTVFRLNGETISMKRGDVMKRSNHNF